MGNVLRVAWWNTGLCPRRGRQSAKDPERWHVTTTVIRQLVLEAGIDVLCLGEVSPEDVEDAHAACAGERPLRIDVERNESQADAISIGILYDGSTIALAPRRSLTHTFNGRRITKQVHAELHLRDTNSTVHLFAAHWPSRMVDQQRHDRRTLGQSLQEEVRGISDGAERPLVLVLGDFNDEPFDDSMSHCLQGSRDRALVRKNQDLLYNPFWRLLGERQTLHAEAYGRLGAGTYYDRRRSPSRWFTFDQILVSAGFLFRQGWTLFEEETIIWQRAPLLGYDGRPFSGFDHFPIVGSFKYIGS